MRKFSNLKILPADDNTLFIYSGVSEVLKDRKPEMPYFYIDEAFATLCEVVNMSLNDVVLIQFALLPVCFAPLNSGNVGAILVFTKKIGEGNISNRSSYKCFKPLHNQRLQRHQGIFARFTSNQAS